MNSYWVAHALAQNRETTKSLRICCHPVDYIVWKRKRDYHTNISNVDELKRRIDSEWAAESRGY